MQNDKTYLVDWLTIVGEDYDPRVAIKIDNIVSGNDGDVTLSFVLFELLYRWEKPLCVDIGADKGWVSLFCTKWNPNAKVIAFEPTDIGFEILKTNTKDYPAITCHKVAISDKKGELAFSLNGSDSHSRSAFNTYFACNTLDQYVGAQEGIHILKIDTEGHEYTILKSIEPILHRIASIVIEWSVYWYGSTLEEGIQKSVEMFEILEPRYPYIYALSRRWPAGLYGPIRRNQFVSFSKDLYEHHRQVDILASIVPLTILPIHSIPASPPQGASQAE